MIQPDVQLGVILVHSIGSGCDTFYKVIKRTPCSVQVRRVEADYLSVDLNSQSCDIEATPVECLEADGSEPAPRKLTLMKPEILRLTDDQIGPQKRMQWWSVWDGKPLNQYSP